MCDDSKYDLVYYNAVCHVCKRRDGALRRCAGCKLVAYCSVAHQATHWLWHKELCKAVRVAVASRGQRFMFAMTAPTTDWDAFRYSAKLLWERQLKRKLWPHEDQLWMFPRVCVVCRSADSQQTLADCPDCLCVSYCSAEHRSWHENTHAASCALLQLTFQIDTHLVATGFTALEIKIPSIVEDLPPDMHSFLAICTDAAADQKTKLWTSGILSFSLTIILAMHHLRYLQGRTSVDTVLAVNVIGAGAMESYLDWTLVLETILHWLHNLHRILIVCIGPECLDDVRRLDISGTFCESCREADKRAEISFRKQFYHDYIYSEGDRSANLNCIFNCGFHEFNGTAQDTWGPSLPYIVQKPVVFTSYTHEEARKDFEVMNNFANNSDILIKCQENPFTSLRPLRNWTMHQAVFYQNNYFSILNPLA